MGDEVMEAVTKNQVVVLPAEATIDGVVAKVYLNYNSYRFIKRVVPTADSLMSHYANSIDYTFTTNYAMFRDCVAQLRAAATTPAEKSMVTRLTKQGEESFKDAVRYANRQRENLIEDWEHAVRYYEFVRKATYSFEFEAGNRGEYLDIEMRRDGRYCTRAKVEARFAVVDGVVSQHWVANNGWPFGKDDVLFATVEAAIEFAKSMLNMIAADEEVEAKQKAEAAIANLAANGLNYEVAA
jgi:uncharacterized protein YprB with RNaseH-like and TPR domain